MARFQSPRRTVALDLEPDGTFTVWLFDESEPFVRTWIWYQGASREDDGGLALQSVTRCRVIDDDRDDDTTRFFVKLADGQPVALVLADGGVVDLAPAT